MIQKPMPRVRSVFELGLLISNATCKISVVLGVAYLVIETIKSHSWLLEFVSVILDVEGLRLAVSEFRFTS